MARTIYQYAPRREFPDVAVGIKLPFNTAADGKPDTINYASGSVNGKGVFNLSYTTEEQAISNLQNLILTKKGERFMQPNFGTNVQNFLFEQLNNITTNDLVDSITSDIELWLPYIIVDSIQSNIEQNELQLRIAFRVTETGANLVINVFANENVVRVSQPVLSTESVLVPIGTFGGAY